MTELLKTSQEYFKLNDTDEILAETLWAAHKATLRGKFIQIVSQLKKERLVNLARLEQDYDDLCKKTQKEPL